MPDKRGRKPEPPADDAPDRSPAGMRATADRIEERSSQGFYVPPSAAVLYAEALRALAREHEKG
ncbi:hypothetical protein [Methylobacterium flocculans]|uniref:hypothetical protein n=1 Tax=Methylobacterium flocculans TaxID=2984843 RepID=UPI0021F3BB0E|nr:hypothetical protein [Methylobacterium sp. FF17]